MKIVIIVHFIKLC